MSWGTAGVAILVALISAGTAFAGGYLGSRWKASSDLAQWRRERLLQFCADFVAIGSEVTGLAALADPKNASAFEAAYRRFDNALSCVLLVGGDVLDDVAFEYRMALLRLRREAAEGKGDEARLVVIEREAAFLAKAHFLLLDIPTRPSVWRRAASWLARPWSKAKPVTPGMG